MPGSPREKVKCGMSYQHNPLMGPVFFTPPGSKRLFKGGGGGSVKYDSLERLYEEQAASARMLRSIAEQNLPMATNAYVGSVQDAISPAYAQKQVNMAGADMASANAQERAATERRLASMGVNPNDPRFAGSLRSIEMSNAARLAAGKNIARNEAQQYQLNIAKDAVGTFTGQSNNAAGQMSKAASGLGSLYSDQANQKAAQDQANAQSAGNIANAGLTAMAMFRKDGGPVKRVERHMLGGAAGSQQGFFQMQNITPPPPSASAPKAQGPSATDVATLAMASKDPTIATALDKAGNFAADKVADLYTSVVGPQSQSFVAPVAEAAITPVAEVAGTAAAEGAAAAGANAAGAGLMGTVGAALPWVGAAYAVGSILDLWNEGGKVGTQNQGMTEAQAVARINQAASTGTLADLRRGGDVPGKWKENRDTVPALLVEDEYVLGAEASKLIGHATLEKLNQKGLTLRKQGKTPNTIKTVGLAGLEGLS